MKKIFAYSLLVAGLIGILFLFSLFDAPSQSTVVAGGYCDEFSCGIAPNQSEPAENVAGQLESKTNIDGPVQVSVALLPSDGAVNFEITLETHSVDLSEDLVQVSTLTDAEGNEYRPVSWEGSPTGGHHREGILRFPASTTGSGPVILKMMVGGVERVFRWQLNLKVKDY